MAKLKIGVIGCGSIARHRHLLEYAMHDDVEIVSVCDIVTERAEEMAALYGAKAYTDYQDLLRDQEVDAVSVCTPNYLHAPVTIAALKAGKHVLCEKPMATSRREAEDMIAAEKESGRKLMIAHNQRFVPSHVEAKELIESGNIGKVYSFRTAFGHGGPEGWSIDGADSWFFKKDQAFIGAMGDLGVHKTDLIQFILGDDITEVASFVETGAKKNSDVDDNAVCVLKTAKGTIGTLAASWTYASAEDNSTIIYGENAILRLEDDPDYSLVIQYKTGEVVNYSLGGIQSNDSGGQTNSHVIEAFVDSIINDKAVLISGEEGKKAVEVILAALDSNEKKQFVASSN